MMNEGESPSIPGDSSSFVAQRPLLSGETSSPSQQSPVTSGDPGRRRAELVLSLGELRRRIFDACTAADRSPQDVTLVAITKTFPIEDAATLLDLGVLDLGENRDQDARVKAAELPHAHWHFVGRLQTNKARSVAGYAGAVHSVDRLELAAALAKAVRRHDRAALDVFIQVSLDGDTARGGVVIDEVSALAEAIESDSALVLRGVMAVAPLGVPPRPAFDRLREVSDRLQSRWPRAAAISAGMSTDLEAAIAAGATHVRVGSALLGHRAPIVS
jgi:pyridoxal phosphate enzyme (YggS family)